MKKILLASVIACTLPLSSVMANDANTFRADFLAGKLSWQQVEAAARIEGKVNFHHWGGADTINGWVDGVAGAAIKKKGIRLNAVRSNPKDSVDVILAEKSAGKGLGEGSVDVMWVNGENFATLKRNNALFGSFVHLLPNAKNFELNADDPRSLQNLRDFGIMNDGAEAPWSGEQYICSYNSATVANDKIPSDFNDLKNYLQQNPGRFVYIKPPHYLGNTFVQTVLYAHTPNGDGAESFQQGAKQISATELARRIKPGMAYLRDIEPYLLGGASGKVQYPNSPTEQDGLFMNKQIDFACKFGYYAASVGMAQGTYPETGKQFIFPKKLMIANKNFLAIAANAPNPASALVFINYMMSVEAQASKLKGAGMPSATDVWKLSRADAKTIQDNAPALIGVTDRQLADNAVSDTNASLVDIIEAVWLQYIERKSDKSIEEITKQVYADMGY